MLSDLSLAELRARIGDQTPTPGGGAVAGIVGALGASLACMAARYSRSKLDAGGDPLAESLIERLEGAGSRFLDLAEADQEAFQSLQQAWKLPKDDPAREGEMRRRSLEAAEPPAAVIRTSAELLEACAGAAPRISAHLKSDLAMACVFCEAAARASRWNILVNARGAGGPEGQGALDRADALLATMGENLRRVCEAYA